MATQSQPPPQSQSPLAISFVTSNAGKVAEVSRMLSGNALLRVEACSLDLPELQGEPQEVAEKKCLAAAQLVKGPVLVEDTSLCYDALGGLPGVYIKWFLEKTGLDGLVNLLMAYEDKAASAQCIFAFCKGPGFPVHVFVGVARGTIVPARGPKDAFGWDAVFQPEGLDKTFAELTKDEKNAISHRGKALRKAVEFLAHHDEQLAAPTSSPTAAAAAAVATETAFPGESARKKLKL